jgi:Family of unknown function (DUF6194)
MMGVSMTDEAIIDHIRRRLDGIDAETATAESGAPEIAWGDTFFIYDPEHILTGAQRFPFATLVTKDYGEFDRASNLNRPGVFRLNIGVGGKTYESLFGSPGPHDLADGGRDFSVPDTLLPHPVYSPQHWVCILNPSSETFEEIVWPLLIEAHRSAAARYQRRRSSQG